MDTIIPWSAFNAPSEFWTRRYRDGVDYTRLRDDMEAMDECIDRGWALSWLQWPTEALRRHFMQEYGHLILGFAEQHTPALHPQALELLHNFELGDPNAVFDHNRRITRDIQNNHWTEDKFWYNERDRTTSSNLAAAIYGAFAYSVERADDGYHMATVRPFYAFDGEERERVYRAVVNLSRVFTTTVVLPTRA